MSEIEVIFNELTAQWEARRDGVIYAADSPHEAVTLLQQMTNHPEDINWIDPTNI